MADNAVAGAILTQVFHQLACNLPLLHDAAQTSARADKKRGVSTLTPFGRWATNSLEDLLSLTLSVALAWGRGATGSPRDFSSG